MVGVMDKRIYSNAKSSTNSDLKYVEIDEGYRLKVKQAVQCSPVQSSDFNDFVFSLSGRRELKL